MKVSIQHILCDVLRILRSPRTTVVAVLDGGLNVFLAADPQDSLVINLDIMVMTEIIVDAAIPLVRTLHVDLFDLFCNCLVFSCPGTLSSGRPSIIGCSGHLQHFACFFHGVSAFRAILLDRLVEGALPYLR